MRLAILALFLCAGPMAICQSTAPAPANSEKQKQPVAQPWMDFGKLPPHWLTKPMPVQSDQDVSRGWNDPQRDWKINPLQPLPQSGEQFGKMLIAQKDGPDPQLPLSSWPNAKVEPIPTQWPNAIVEAIPTQWPNFKLLPIKSGSPVMLQAPAYGDLK